MKSYIVEFIKKEKNWEKLLEIKNIRVNIEDDLAIFNYGMDADFSDPIVQEARGIIIDLKSLTVVCWPFRKFGNYGESYADSIDWNNCRVEDKIDGSIVKLFYYKRMWLWATNGRIDAFDASATESESFGDIIESAINFNDIPFGKLNPDYTYIFELVSPDTQVVIHYPIPKLYHIGTRNNVTGEEYKIDIGIEQPKIYDIHTLNDCILAAEKLNQDDGDIKKEGFVVVDKNWNRVKIKSPKYLMLHHAWNNGNLSKQTALELIKWDTEEELNAHEFILQFKVILRYYQYKLVELEYNISKYIDYVRGLYEEYNHDRKAVALMIKNHKFSSFGFESIGNDKTAKEMIDNTSVARLCKLIPDYEKESIL